MMIDNFYNVTADLVLHNLIKLKHLVFEVTDACNLRCKYCAYAEMYEGYDQRNNINMPFHKAKLVIDYLQKLWEINRYQDMEKLLTISFYGGEPLLNMELIKLIIAYTERLPQTGRIFKYSMTTNAMLLDKYMDYLVEKDFNLLISLDGDETGQSYRTDNAGNNTFQRVFKNIILLKEKYPSFWENNVNFNAVQHNRNGLERTYEFYKDYIGKTPIISPINPAGIRKDKQEEFRQIYYNIPEEIRQSPFCELIENELFIRAPRIASVVDYLHKYSGNYFSNYLSLYINKEKLFHYSTGTCTPFAKKMFVTVNGKILPCERIAHDYVMGQVTETEVLLDYEKIADKHNKYISQYIKQCKHCAISKYCRICAYQEDEISKGSNLCSYYTTKAQLEAEQKATLAYLGKHPELYRRIFNEVSVGE